MSFGRQPVEKLAFLRLVSLLAVIMPCVVGFFRAPSCTLPTINVNTVDLNAIRKPIPADYLRLIVVSALWGSAFMCNAIALADFAPVAIAAYRVLLAALLMLLICRWQGLSFVPDTRTSVLFIAIGLLNSAIPFSLIGWGQQSVDSATTAILISASPFVTLLLSHYMTRDDRFSWYKLAGLVVGFSGVVVLLAEGVLQGGASIGGMLAIALAACCYATSAQLIRKLSGISSLIQVTGTLITSAVVLVPLTLILHPPLTQSFSQSSLLALAFLSIGPTAIAYVLRTQIIQVNGAVFMSSAGYLIPVFAVFWAWVFLSESPRATVWIALALVLGGIAIGQSGKQPDGRSDGRSDERSGRQSDG